MHSLHSCSVLKAPQALEMDGDNITTVINIDNILFMFILLLFLADTIPPISPAATNATNKYFMSFSYFFSLD